MFRIFSCLPYTAVEAIPLKLQLIQAAPLEVKLVTATKGDEEASHGVDACVAGSPGKRVPTIIDLIERVPVRVN